MAKDDNKKRGFFSKLIGKGTNYINHREDLHEAATTYNELREKIEASSSKLSDKAVVLFQLRNDAYSAISESLLHYVESLNSCPSVINNGLNFAISNYDAVIAEYINDPAKFNNINPDNISNAPNGVAFLGTTVVGSGVAIGGSSALLAIATTFGTAGTGAAISSLGGVAATNAALAWIGGGTIAAGGAGMAGGATILSLMGPIGWGIAGIGALAFLGLNAKDRTKNMEAIGKLEEGIKQLIIVESQLNNAHKVIDGIIEDTKSFYDNVVEFLSGQNKSSQDYNSSSYNKQSLFSIIECAKNLSKLSKQSVNLNSMA